MTNLTTTQNTVSIYVGTYSKYNQGSLFGAWIDLTDLTEEEFNQKCIELHKDEQDPEFMFQDFDIEFDSLRNLVSESGIDSDFWELKDNFNEVKDYCLEAFDIFISNGHPADANKFKDAYRGHCNEYNIEQAFGEQIADEMGYIQEIPEHLRYYFDFEAFGRDLLMTDFWEQDGHIFYNHY